MRKVVLTVVLALILLSCAITVATAEMWIGAQGGPSFNSSTIKIGPSQFDGSKVTYNGTTGFATGVVLGYNFNNFGAGAYAWPDWMRYVGVQMDLSYNQFNLYCNSVPAGNAIGFFGTRGFPASRNISGDTLGLVFLATVKYPGMASNEYPGGRLQPYVGVGPGVMINSFNNNPSNVSLPGTTNVALVAEAGVRYMVTPAFETKLAYRFQHQFDSGGSTFNGMPVSYDVNNNQVLLGVAYHF